MEGCSDRFFHVQACCIFHGRAQGVVAGEGKVLGVSGSEKSGRGLAVWM
jgi:hypothetical protein